MLNSKYPVVLAPTVMHPNTHSTAQPTALRFAAIQLAVGADKADNVSRAIACIRRAVTQTDRPPRLIALPECFNSPYGTKYFGEYAEAIPGGYTTDRLSAVARELGVYVVGGTIPECDEEGVAADGSAPAKPKLYNTCTVWGPDGGLIAKYRKMHLFDIDVEGGVRFKESDVLSAGSEFRTISVDGCKIGLGVCYDLRFEEHARVYRNMGESNGIEDDFSKVNRKD